LENGKYAFLNLQDTDENSAMKAIFEHSVSFLEKTKKNTFR